MKLRHLTLALLAGAAMTASMTAGGAEAAYKQKAVANAGTIQGRVAFEGAPPKLAEQVIAKDNEVCGDGSVIPNPVKVGDGGALEDVVVYLKKVKAGKPWPEQDYAVNQMKCAFEPYLQVVPKNVELTIVNSDPVLHNVHPFEHVGDSRRTLFNLAQPKQDQTNVKKIKTRRGQAVELACDAHAWMAGWLYVLEHPYYDVVGADGVFDIGEVPPGSYTLIAWHPVLGTQEQAVEVAADGQVEAAFAFQAP